MNGLVKKIPKIISDGKLHVHVPGLYFIILQSNHIHLKFGAIRNEM
jgi:hypothetical protein